MKSGAGKFLRNKTAMQDCTGTQTLWKGSDRLGLR